jgi:hypothetical protein
MLKESHTLSAGDLPDRVLMDVDGGKIIAEENTARLRHPSIKVFAWCMDTAESWIKPIRLS